jgi:hypothetical protein
MTEPNEPHTPEEHRSASASGQRAVAVGGPVSQSAIVTGDHTTLIFAMGERRFDGVLTLGEWERKDPRGFAVPWVDFAARSQLIERIRAHLRNRSGPNVLHIAGLSGVGKSRTALEACRGQGDLEGVGYVPRYAQLDERFLLHLTRNEHLVALVVVDEVPLEDLRSFTYKIEEFGHRLRFVTIGPARRNERGRSSANILVMPEPATREGVLEVVRQAGAGLSEPVLESIAHFAAHDLRLALMLVEATQQDGEFRDLPIEDGESVWRRVTSLFRERLGDLDAFRTHYPFLTVAIEIGIRHEVRHELEYVAGQFAVDAPRFDDAINHAVPCGLGVVTPSNFFEPTPRALAGHLFRQRVWGSLRNRLDSFLGGLPDRLLRRFVERCQDCVGPEREEMEVALADFFQGALGSPDVRQLIDRDRSRLFKAWAELDPVHGLGWLQRAVEQASDEQLRCLDGAPDGSGGWRGRRQVVWLCEGLASFRDYFRSCEAVLFRLAQVETEPSIGNNSTETWKGLFLPILAFTEVPFPERADLLLRYLAEADEGTLPLVLSAVVGAIAVPTGRLVPPRVIGGRLAPEPWCPATSKELQDLQRDLGWHALEAVGRLPAPVRYLGRMAVASNFPAFVRLGLVGEMRGLLAEGDEALSQAVRLQLRRLVELREGIQKRRGDSSPDPVLEDLRRWQAELQPSGLVERVKDLTSLDYWEAMRASRNPEESEEESPYAQLAGDILDQPEVLNQLSDWFDSDQARSAFSLGMALGEADREETLAVVVNAWVKAAQCHSLIGGYLRGVVSRLGTLPPAWGERLDQVSDPHPEFAAYLTVNADFSQAGRQRIMRLVESGTVPPTYLNTFTSPEWVNTSGVEEKAAILELLVRVHERDPQQALRAALSLCAAWTQYGKEALPDGLEGPALQILRGALQVRVDPHTWTSLLESLARTNPEETADVATDALTSAGPMRLTLDDSMLEVLLNLSRRHPRVVMDAVGRRLLDPDRRVFFELHQFSGLFEAIGLPEVQRWVTEHGPDPVPLIARHLDSPSLQQDGEPVIPPLTDWVLREFENDGRTFEAFCMGRHAIEVQVGHARERRAELERAVGPFLQHSLPWVRRWAEYELRENDREAEIDDYLDDRRDRM